jgi:hypothetical protein
MKTLYDCPIHFNLLETAPMSGKWDWSPIKLIARSDKFVFKGSTKLGQPRYISQQKLAERLAQLPKNKNRLSVLEKVVIGIVPVISLIFLLGAIWRLWWLPHKRKKIAEKGGTENGGDMPAELKRSEDQDAHELESEDSQKAIEVDYDTYIRELGDGKPAARELDDTPNTPIAELDGGWYAKTVEK